MVNKILVISIIVYSSIYFLACSSVKPPEYVAPANAPERFQKAFTQSYHDGKILYELNCSMCHEPNVIHKDYTPEFTRQQLENYFIRFSNDEHAQRLTAPEISPEELSSIHFYLDYVVRTQLEINESKNKN